MLKETLEQSLIELCKSDTVHYEVTANEISNIRLALLKMEGVNIQELCDIEGTFKAWSELNNKVKQLQEQKEKLRIQLMILNEEIKEQTLALENSKSKGKVTKSASPKSTNS